MAPGVPWPLHAFSRVNPFSPQYYKSGIIAFPILQMGKPRHREVRVPSHGHTAWGPSFTLKWLYTKGKRAGPSLFCWAALRNQVSGRPPRPSLTSPSPPHTSGHPTTDKGPRPGTERETGQGGRNRHPEPPAVCTDCLTDNSP